MKIFFDEDNGTAIPRALQLVRAPCEEILYPRKDGPVPLGSADVDWISHVGSRGYLAFSQNKRLLDVPHERAALVAARLGIVFTSTGRSPAYETLRLLLNRWDWLREIDRNEVRPFAFILPFSGPPRRVAL